MKRKAHTAAEQDVVHARKWYCYLDRPGVCARIKRGMTRRERQEAKARIRKGADPW